uniref:GUB_WAK_bind domain-containing protein n=1 Tax=Steinernema glaseri TaxID=37863 RepID=A0A1I8A0S4_9BILA
MAERVTHLSAVAAILFLSFLYTSAVVPAPTECWEDRIFAFSGSRLNCNATKQCVNETALLEEATKECGQKPKNHTFRERCGHRHYFSIDYTCCAPDKYHDRCLPPRRWNRTIANKIFIEIQKTMRLTRRMHEAWRTGNISKAPKYSSQIYQTKDVMSSSIWHIFFESEEHIPGCTNFKEFTQMEMTFGPEQYMDYFGEILLEPEYNCTKHMSNYYGPPEWFSPKYMTKEKYSFSGGCYFFPELEKPIEEFVRGLYRDMSPSLVPQEEDFWNDEHVKVKYCEWLLQKMTDPKFEQKESSHATFAWALFLLLLAGSVLGPGAAGFTLGRRRAEEKSSGFINHVFNEEESRIP